jgi:hypothetical protein
VSFIVCDKVINGYKEDELRQSLQRWLRMRKALFANHVANLTADPNEAAPNTPHYPLEIKKRLNVVMPLLADFTEGLDADGQFLTRERVRHKCIVAGVLGIDLQL